MNLSRRPPPPLPERLVEYVLFTSRWLLAPIYLGLVAGLAVLLVKFVQHTAELITHVLTTNGDDTIVGVLGLIDLALMGSLVVMVMFAGYENFVSKLDLAGHKEQAELDGARRFQRPQTEADGLDRGDLGHSGAGKLHELVVSQRPRAGMERRKGPSQQRNPQSARRPRRRVSPQRLEWGIGRSPFNQVFCRSSR